MSINLKQKLVKEISQVVFRPTIPSASSYLDVAKGFEADFQEWARKNDTYTLYSPNDLKAILFNNNSITFSEESHDGKPLKVDSIKQVGKAVSSYIKKFSISEVRRIGYGLIHIYEAEIKYDELCELIFQKFYSNNSDIQNISIGKTPRDVVFILDGEKNSLSNHIELGPTNKEESLKRFSSTFTGFESKIQLSEPNIYIAIDSFIDNKIDLLKTEELLESTKKESVRLLEAYLSYLNS